MLLRKWRSCHFAPKNIIFFSLSWKHSFYLFQKNARKREEKTCFGQNSD